MTQVHVTGPCQYGLAIKKLNRIAIKNDKTKGRLWRAYVRGDMKRMNKKKGRHKFSTREEWVAYMRKLGVEVVQSPGLKIGSESGYHRRSRKKVTLPKLKCLEGESS